MKAGSAPALSKLYFIDQKEIIAISKVKLFGMEIGNKLNFNHHINSICLKPTQGLNKTKMSLKFPEKKSASKYFCIVDQYLINSFLTL